MSKPALPKREIAICARLREARELRGLTQEACAEAVGIERSTLSNFEYATTPVRFEVALRFCRRLIISEEWLATGAHKSMHAVLIAHGLSKTDDWSILDREILHRQCMDLGAEPEARSIRPRTLFSVAFDDVLQPVYARLTMKFSTAPRIMFSPPVPEKELLIAYSGWLDERTLRLLSHSVPPASGKNPWECLQQMLRAVFEVREAVYSRYRDTGFDAEDLRHLAVDIAQRANAGVRMVGVDAQATGGLDTFSNRSNTDSVQKQKSLIATVLDKVRAATIQRGAKSSLASSLGVTRQQISDWLSGNKTPSAEYALALDAWVSTPVGANQNEAAAVLSAQRRRKAQSRKDHDEKTTSGPPRK